jgi:Cep192 domain 4
LTDSSQTPATALSGQEVDFAIGNATCSATTNSSGIATCSLTPGSYGMETLSADFPGTRQYVASSATSAFNVVQPTVTGKLKISPKRLNFGTVAVNSSKTRTVKITNAGKITKKKTASPIIINYQTATPGAFQVTDDCSATLDPKAKHEKPGTCTVTVTFTPSSAQKYSGTLTILDNLEPNLYQTVTMIGTGK